MEKEIESLTRAFEAVIINQYQIEYLIKTDDYNKILLLSLLKELV